MRLKSSQSLLAQMNFKLLRLTTIHWGSLGPVLLTHHCLHLLKSILEPLALGNIHIRMTSNADYLYFCFQRDATASWKEHGQRFTNIICQKPLALSGPCWTWTNRTPNGELIGVQLLLLWIGIHRKSHNKLQTSTNHTMPVQSAILGPRADALSIGILRSFSFRPGRGLVQDSVDKNGFPWHQPSRNNCKIL